MFRGARVFATLQRCRTHVVAPARILTRFQARNLASRLNTDDILSSEQAQKVAQISEAFLQNPDIRKSLERFQKLLASKGLDKGPSPSLFKMMLLLGQSDIRAALNDLKTSLEAANIELTPSDMHAIMTYYRKHML